MGYVTRVLQRELDKLEQERERVQGLLDTHKYSFADSTSDGEAAIEAINTRINQVQEAIDLIENNKSINEL